MDFLRDWSQAFKVFSQVMNLGASETAPSLKCSESTSPNPSAYSGGASGEEPTCQCRRHKRHEFNSWVGKIPWERAWQPTPVFLPRRAHRQRSLAGYSQWGCRVWHDRATNAFTFIFPYPRHCSRCRGYRGEQSGQKSLPLENFHSTWERQTMST